jgi:hypothetical protein
VTDTLEQSTADEFRFAWHPQYRGQTTAEVRAHLMDDLRLDQRSYAITMDGPDENESEILVRVVGLEKKWGPYALDWATADPATIVDRAVAFERERDARRELFPYAEYRDRHAPVARTAPAASADGDDVPSAAPWWAFWRR